ncbi:MAG: site-specific DNA-methyltransferase [Butyrivibrio hungatei]|nr:site-specific DNA-methyltransferase [Butyrivibrio hungatei]
MKDDDAKKPIHLMKTLIELTTIENQIVLDPFMGSGSTLVAAVRCNRDFIGFERNKDFYHIAKERIEEEVQKRDGKGNIAVGQ